MYQMTLFDAEPKQQSPVEYLAEKADWRWTDSGKRLRESARTGDIAEFAKTVREEYCPHGYGGRYGTDGPYIGWEMTKAKIKIYRSNLSDYETITWRQFAKELMRRYNT